MNKVISDLGISGQITAGLWLLLAAAGPFAGEGAARRSEARKLDPKSTWGAGFR
jgi:hypothetical protein